MCVIVSFPLHFESQPVTTTAFQRYCRYFLNFDKVSQSISPFPRLFCMTEGTNCVETVQAACSTWLPEDGFYIFTLITVRFCTIMHCIYVFIFSANKILFKSTSSPRPYIVKTFKNFFFSPDSFGWPRNLAYGNEYSGTCTTNILQIMFLC